MLAKLALVAITACASLGFTVDQTCSCLSRIRSDASVSRKVRYERQRSKAVFSGEVMAIVERNTRDAHNLEVTFRVIEAWKGIRTNIVSVITPHPSPYSCGYAFQVGQQYLVYVERFDNGNLWTDICSRTMRLTDAEEDLQVLGRGRRF